jgi:hypothetical protein
VNLQLYWIHEDTGRVTRVRPTTGDHIRFYMADDVDARIAHLEAVNAAHLARHVELNRQLANELETNHQLHVQVRVYKRAVEWLKGEALLTIDGVLHVGNMPLEVPAEFAEIIRSKS